MTLPKIELEESGPTGWQDACNLPALGLPCLELLRYKEL